MIFVVVRDCRFIALSLNRNFDSCRKIYSNYQKYPGISIRKKSPKCDQNEPENEAACNQLTETNTHVRDISVMPGKGEPPTAPSTCCMSGCANCVWIKYSEELIEYYNDGGEKAREAIEQMEDENVKAFLKLTLK
ncbi:OXLD1 (predicted) [Pycnogonum litorale]